MAVTAASFKAKYTQFANLADAEIDPWLADAEAYCSESYFGTDTDRAVELWTAHVLLTNSQAERGVTGALTSLSVDRESYSFGGGGQGYESTSYGLRFLDLQKRHYLGGLFV